MTSEFAKNTRDRIVVGSLTTIATLGCCFLLVCSAYWLLFESPRITEAIVIWLVFLSWLSYTFGSVAFKVAFRPHQKHFVNLVSLIIFNSVLTALVLWVLWVLWIYVTDVAEYSKISVMNLGGAMGGLAAISFIGWIHIFKRLND